MLSNNEAIIKTMKAHINIIKEIKYKTLLLRVDTLSEIRFLFITIFAIKRIGVDIMIVIIAVAMREIGLLLISEYFIPVIFMHKKVDRYTITQSIV